MPRCLRVAYAYFIFLFFIGNYSYAQIYHFETGKVLGSSKPDTILWKEGVFNNYPAKFGTLIVKENRRNRNSRLINIPIIVVKAVKPNDSLAPIFALHGGPGESNLQKHLFFEELVQNRDMVFVGYRGVDGSVKLDCPCYEKALKSDTLTLDNAEMIFQLAADSCLNILKSQEINIEGYSMHEVVEDIEITRQILNYDSINFLAFSYGTMLAQLYAQTYDTLIKKMVLIGARPLDKFLFESDVLNNQLNDLYLKQFIKNKADTLEDITAKAELILNKIANENTQINIYKLYFFSFSKLYIIKDLEKHYNAFKQALKGDATELIRQYNEFFKFFPGDLVLGDVFIKKQGMIDAYEMEVMGNSGLNTTSKLLNSFYSPRYELLFKKHDKKHKYQDSINNVFLISGEFDFATLMMNSFSSNTEIQIEDAGHLDIFYSKRKTLMNIVNKCYNQ